MNIKVSATQYDNPETYTKGFASVTFDDKYALEHIVIKQNSNGGLYVELPKIAKKQKENGADVFDYNGNIKYEYVEPFHPITADAREQLYTAIIDKLQDNQKGYKTYRISAGSNISRVYANEINGGYNGKTAGIATVSFGDSFILENVAIMNGQNGEYLRLPKYRQKAKGENGQPLYDENGKEKYEYRDIFHPITAEAQEELKQNVISALNNKRKANAQRHMSATQDDIMDLTQDQYYGR